MNDRTRQRAFFILSLVFFLLFVTGTPGRFVWLAASVATAALGGRLLLRESSPTGTK